MNHLSARSVLGLLTTLVGALGCWLPAHGSPTAPGSAADLEAVQAASEVPTPATVEPGAAEPAAAESVEAEPVSADSLAVPQWERAEAAIAASAILPQGAISWVPDEAPTLPAGVPLANRRENSQLFQFQFGGDQVPLNPPPTEPLRPVVPQPEVVAYSLTLIPERDIQVPANGRSVLPLVGQITAADGTPLAGDVVVTVTTSAGELIGADYDPDRGGFQVLARQGQYRAQLRSAIDAQSVTVRAYVEARALREIDPALREGYPALEATTQVSFYTDLRPTIISGVVDFRVGRGGTNFLGSFRDFLNPDALNQDVEVSFTTGLFATGSVGDWLFTGAYNNTRGLNDRCDGSSLYRDVQACDQTYPVYGDSSTTDFLTPSIDSLYLRFQRDSLALDAGPDYFMWGDYGTQEFAGPSQQFTATVRELHGFKGNYTFGNGLQITAMYADNVRPFQRDTIAPDGTSGYYFLSQRVIVRGSENVFLETEEFNRPGTVLERKPLYRGTDYDIDYDRGTLLFRQPVSALDLNPLGVTLVRRIVVTYEVDDPAVSGSLYAGRLQYRPAGDDGGVVGASLLTEDQGAQDFTLYGVDFLWPLGEQGEITGEFARSSFNLGGTNSQGNAYRLELSGTPLTGVTGQAYYRATDSGFNNTATSTFNPGQTRWGGQLLAQVGPQTQLRAVFDQERNVGPTTAVQTSALALLNPGQNAIQGGRVDNTLTELRAGIVQQIGSATLGIDFVNRDRSDRIANQSANASQLVSRFNLPLTATLSALAQSELNLGTADTLYPTRNTVGLEWAVQPGVSLRLAQQFLSGGQGPGSITSLDTLVDYQLDDNTTLTNRYSLLGGYNGITGQGAIGLNHRLVLAPGLRATFGFERVFGDAFNLTGAGQQFAQPFAVGQGAASLGLQASTVYSAGLEYTDNPDWQASGRIEFRDSPQSSNLVLGLAAAGRLSDALTGLARFDLGNFANQTITDQLGNSSSLKLGLAYRNPVSDQFNGLLSYEYRRNPSTTPDTILQGSGATSQDHTLALEGIYAPDWQWEFYGKYALRASTANLAQNFGFANTIHLAQLRATYRFAYRWDVGGEVRWVGQPVVGYNETGFALEAGYYLTPDVRLGLGYSFGGANDGSFNGGGGYRSASGPYFGITAKVNQLFNRFGVQPVSPPQQQESYVEESAQTDEPVGEIMGAAPGGEE
ncbi:MAG TPA: TonB-dependent receptor [Nodosilinea sp.]|nr:TonB-dependent receptor [Nodosilinea sp.]